MTSGTSSAIPPYGAFFRVFLDALSDGQAHKISEIREAIAQRWQLSPEALKEQLPSGKGSTFSNRVAWASVYLHKAGLVHRPARGTFQLTQEGARVQQDPSLVVDNHFLNRYPSFVAFLNKSAATTGTQKRSETERTETPQDTIAAAVQQINSALADDLMNEIMNQSPTFFERLVVQLLLKMGYGGPFEEAGIVTQATSDGGIDGIIKEDKLGFSQIYIQAKRWNPDTTVNRPEIHKFSGALQDRGASKGLFITTAKFSAGAMESAKRQHIVLIDGDTLTRLMMEYNLGVSVSQTYAIKKLDTDFFSDDD